MNRVECKVKKRSKCRRLPKNSALGQILKDVDFPADKQKIIQHVQRRSADNTDSQNVLSTLQKIEDKQYNNVAEVTKNWSSLLKSVTLSNITGIFILQVYNWLFQVYTQH